MKKFKVTNEDKTDILSQHKKLKSDLIEKLVEKYHNPRILISEVDGDWRDSVIKKCPVFVNHASDVTKYKMKDGTKVIRFNVTTNNLATLKQRNPKAPFAANDVIFVYEDKSLDWYRVTTKTDKGVTKKIWKNLTANKKGTWNCGFVDLQQVQVDRTALDQFKKSDPNGPWYEYSEVMANPNLPLVNFADEKSYDKIEKFGVTLYHPKSRSGQVEYATKDQADYVKDYLDRGWKFPGDPILTGPQKDNYVAAIVPGSEKAYPPDGIKMYKPREDIKLQGSDIILRAKDAIQKNKFTISFCKDALRNYWDSWELNISSGNAPDMDLYQATQFCVWQYQGSDWTDKKVAILTGQDELNAKADVLTGKKGSYDGTPAPFADSKWRLKPKGFQPYTKRS